MNRACPVTCAFLRAVRNHNDFTLVQNEIWLDSFLGWEERAASGGASRLLQHQRAFLCVELMVYRLAPAVQQQLPGLTDMQQWPRSRGGISYVLNMVSSQREGLVADISEHYFAGGRFRGVDELTHTNQQRAAELCKLICESCVIIRQSLKNTDVTLTRVGRRLALAAGIARRHMPDIFNMAADLLDQSEGKALRAWELSTR